MSTDDFVQDPNPVKKSTRKLKVAIVEKGDGKAIIVADG